MTTTLAPNSAPATAPTPRTAAAIAADLEQRRTRRADLAARLNDVTAARAQFQAARARALADDTAEPDPDEARRLQDEAEGLTHALELLAGDVTTLEHERDQTAVIDAERAEQTAVVTATEIATELDALVRSLGDRQLLPLADRLNAALADAWNAEKAFDSLAKRVNGIPSPIGSDSRTHRAVVHSRPALVPLMAAIRAYVAGKALPNPFDTGRDVSTRGQSSSSAEKNLAFT